MSNEITTSPEQLATVIADIGDALENLRIKVIQQIG